VLASYLKANRSAARKLFKCAHYSAARTMVEFAAKGLPEAPPMDISHHQCLLFKPARH
jgi:hypothetical protein